MSRKPVIALVCDVIHPYSHGGREVRYYELSQRLAARFEVHVYTMNWWNGPRVRTEGGVTFHAISRLYPLYSGDRRSLRQAIFFALACFRLLWHAYDVIEADHIPSLQIYVLRIVASLRRKRLVVTWHEVWSRDYWESYLGRLGRLAWFLETFAMRLPDHIIAASPGTADRLQAALSDRTRITIAPNGIDLNLIRSVQADPANADIVSVGRLIDHKRMDLLLDVVAMLHAEGRAVTCRIIGDGPCRDALREQAKRLQIAHAVHFSHDVAEQKELYALIKSGRVFVSLSEREGFGIAVLEALACGLPVLTTSAPDNLAQELVSRSPIGTICAPTVASVHAALKSCLAEGALPPADSYDQSWLSEYDWSTTADHVIEAYSR